MEYKFNFKNEDEKEELIKQNLNLTLIKLAYHLSESFLIFTDEEIQYELTETKILGNKIDILEDEKEALKKVTKEQDDLLVDNAFKIAEIQMKLGGI